MRAVEPGATASDLSAQRRSNARNGKLGRSDDQFIGRPQDSKTLLLRPDIPFVVFCSLFDAVMGRPVDFHDEPSLDAYKVDDEVSKRDLPTRFCSFATPVPD